MKPATATIIVAMAALGACDRTEKGPPTAPAARAEVANSAATSVPPAAADRRDPPQTSLPEPKGPIDPKSVEVAGQVVQHYGALIEQDGSLEAARLWSDLDAARSFAAALDSKFKDVHLEIGELGATEGAAGSIYTSVPVIFYGTSQRGQPLRMSAEVILRRVNDVPGSTERQRRWHIERFDWKNGD